MRKLIIILLALYCSIGTSFATDNTDQKRLSPQEFREKQQAFITKIANLTADEADKFFPIYFELQEKKKEMNDKMWRLMREGKKETTTDARYGEIVEEVYNIRISIDKLDKSYNQKFKKLLSNKKLYMVQDAEVRFRRDMLKDFGHKPQQPRPKRETEKK
jgi:Spy/CpxP family protein refolding chaperone